MVPLGLSMKEFQSECLNHVQFSFSVSIISNITTHLNFFIVVPCFPSMGEGS